MKKLVVFMAICCVAIACNKGVQKDFVSGVTVKNNGLSIGEAVLVDSNNARTKSTEVMLGTTVAIVAQEIDGYELKDGRAYPGLDLTVVDKDGTVVLEGDDILADEQGYTPEDAAVLRGTITVGSPMVAGKTYHATMRVWDKLKPENEITVDVDLLVK